MFTGNGSSTWLAIEYGLELVKQGYIWHVGNGADIRIWRDPWIPRGPSFEPITPKRRCRLKWVAGPLNADGSWNTTLIRQHFFPVDVMEIIKIKPSRQLEADSVAWQPDKTGRFFVRSAYNMALDAIMAREGIGETSARPDGTRPAWNLLWKCGAPPKVCVFAWKAAREALASRESMKRRHMEHDGTCTLCGQEDETAHHALVRCPQARNLWSAMRLVWDLPPEDALRKDEPDWLLLLLQKPSETQRMLLLMVLWRVWHVRNEITHNKPIIPVEASKQFLCGYVESLLMIKHFLMLTLSKGNNRLS